MQSVFNEETFNVSYVTNPANGGYSSLLRFSRPDTGTENFDRGFLCQEATVDFRRNAEKRFFINHSGVAYTLGRGTGTLSLRGMLGQATEFAALFGSNFQSPCSGIYTAMLDAFGLESCEIGRQHGTIIMFGVVPTGFAVTAQVMDNTGALWYTANATFEIGNLGVSDTLQSKG